MQLEAYCQSFAKYSDSNQAKFAKVAECNFVARWLLRKACEAVTSCMVSLENSSCIRKTYISLHSLHCILGHTNLLSRHSACCFIHQGVLCRGV